MIENRDKIFEDFRENYDFDAHEFSDKTDYEKLIAMIETLKMGDKI